VDVNDNAQIAVHLLHDALNKDPAYVQVVLDQEGQRLVVVTEPGRTLSDATADVIMKAQSTVRVVVEEGLVSISELRRVENALLNAARSPDLVTTGLMIRKDALNGKVVLEGDPRTANALLASSGVDASLVTIKAASPFRRRALEWPVIPAPQLG
jgi:phenylpyruvate tautomerase PptA (4-oxalocrotonate tautomerase family)